DRVCPSQEDGSTPNMSHLAISLSPSAPPGRTNRFCPAVNAIIHDAQQPSCKCHLAVPATPAAATAGYDRPSRRCPYKQLFRSLWPLLNRSRGKISGFASCPDRKSTRLNSSHVKIS